MAKQVYTEADVRALPAGAELVLGKGAIATPSALDAAFARGIRVVRASGDGAPPAGGAGGCLWGRLLAVDGSYAVTVKAGRAVVHRLTPEGPVEVGRGGGCS